MAGSAAAARLAVVAIGSIGAWRGVQRIGEMAADAPHGFDRAASAPPPGPSPRPRSCEGLDRVVAFAVGNAADVHFRLRPVLRAVALQRLRDRYGVKLDEQPGPARVLLGDDLFALVHADRPPPTDRRGPGLPLAQLAALVDTLEAL